MRPFALGNELTLREFAVELARTNQLSLRWEKPILRLTDNHVFVEGRELAQAASLRRLIMLAMDEACPPFRPTRGNGREREAEGFVYAKGALL